jgi:hypothetical protein
VTVIDDAPPIISCPADIDVNHDPAACSAVVGYTAPGGTDNCSGATTDLSGGLGSGGSFPLGTTVETYTVTDGAGNIASCSFGVTVHDTVAPALTCPVSIDLEAAACLGTVPVPFEGIVAQDQCGSVSISATPPDIACGQSDTAVVSAIDESGNVSACEVPVSLDCSEPLSQGYWHRQCLGAGLITPGRNGQGRGPTTVLEPEFVKELKPAVDLRLQNTVMEFRTCADGIDAEPPSDKCEKAIKQYTSLLLNIASHRLADSCAIDVSVAGCGSLVTGDLVTELAALINSGVASNCNLAASCAAAMNENQFGIPLEPPGATGGMSEDSVALFEGGSAVDSAADSRDPAPVEFEAADIGTEAGSLLGLATTASADDPPLDTPGVDSNQEIRTVTIIGSDASRSIIERHLAIVAGNGASEDQLRASEDALLTALGGGYEADLRLQIVRRLAGTLDVVYDSLLAKHLEDIRLEAMELGNRKVADEAAELLKRFDLSGGAAE